MKNKINGMLLMILSSAAFAMMQVLIAMTAKRIPVFEQMIFRNIATAIIAYVALRRKRIPIFGKRENRKLLAARSVFGALGMFCLFFATAIGNQAEVAILTKLSPFVVILLARLIFHEKMTGFQLCAMLIAFSGAYITADPQMSTSVLPAIIAVMASVFAGVAYFYVGALKGKEPPEVTVFFFSAFTTVVTGVMMVFDFVVPSAADFLLLLGISVMASIGQLALTYSYTLAKASEVSVFNYAGIPFSMVLGLILLDQPIKATTFVGSILVILSGIISFVGEKRVSNAN